MFSVFARLAPCKSVDFRLSPPINGQQVSPFQRLALYVVELMGISSLARRAAHNLKSAGPNLTEQLITATHFRRVTKPRLISLARLRRPTADRPLYARHRSRGKVIAAPRTDGCFLKSAAGAVPPRRQTAFRPCRRPLSPRPAG